ncbi:hypothetical protein NG791_14935 [Laspinema sp. D1]|uniref:hypothetical protein n=1 Tax=Laspinema palackyanum TaxID=3231601 RepID=UPI003490D51B|nr:hypothetical protein [Laspinema sp. D2b]
MQRPLGEMVYRARLNQFVELPDRPTPSPSVDPGVAGDAIGIAKSGRRQDAIAPKGTNHYYIS